MRTCSLHSRQLCLQSAARTLPGDLEGQQYAERCVVHWTGKLQTKLKNIFVLTLHYSMHYAYSTGQGQTGYIENRKYIYENKHPFWVRGGK